MWNLTLMQTAASRKNSERDCVKDKKAFSVTLNLRVFYFIEVKYIEADKSELIGKNNM